MTISENIGHTIGLMTAVCMSIVFDLMSARLLPALGAISAIMAVLFMKAALIKEGKHEDSNDNG